MDIISYFDDLNTIHINTEKPRCYYVPTSCELPFDCIDARSVSDRFLSINGEWQFGYYECVDDVPDEVLFGEYKLNDVIRVPSTWQSYGYDKHQYVNLDYTLPFNPPYVPRENPCGVYKRKFILMDSSLEKYYLNFEGVDSCFYVWVNGEFIGYSQVSHCSSEFDISNVIKKGENDITVLVFKWCSGSYFEAQDKFRETGIFRDVYILKRPKEHIRDFKILTKLTDDLLKATVIINIEKTNRSDIPVFYVLKDKEEQVISSGKISDSCAEVEINRPLLWNAEEPNLYILHLHFENEVITTYVGIRKITIEDSVVKVNGKPIMIKGVNRHDSHPLKGAAVSIDDVIEDMTLMKQNNINAIRTAHYPNSPYFPSLCDYFGFYLMAESDLETHGLRKIYPPENQFSILNNDAKYQKVFLDRQVLNYERDKNHPSVIFWSIGNESGFGKNIEACAEYYKKVDPERLVHYESMYHDDEYEPDTSNLDLISYMYPSDETLNNYFDSQSKLPMTERKALILCEYGHCMGNGPGDFEDYFELFLSHPEFAGGFVWEWCDHAVYSGVAADEKNKYLYGGDFGEKVHDSNYCVDGLVYPDRTISNSLRELKNVYRPARINYLNGEFSITNICDFVNLKELVYIEYEIKTEGIIKSRGKVDNIDVMPRQTVKFSVDIPEDLKGETYIIFNIRSIKSDRFIKRGHIFGFDQFCLLSENLEYEFQSDIIPDIKEEKRFIKIFGDGFEYTFDKRKGVLSSFKIKGNELFEKPAEFNIWRAPTDNDISIKNDWFRVRYDDAYVNVLNVTCNVVDNDIIINNELSIVANGIQKIVDANVQWRINGKGEICFNGNIVKNNSLPPLPRFGLRFFFNKDFENIEYFGKGPYESYIDKQRASYVDLFNTTVTDNHEDYIRPQENGSHIDTSYVILKCKNNIKSVKVKSLSKAFSFNVSHYTQENLQNTKHSFELVEDPYTILCIDYAQNGIGSQSCGPKLNEKYCFNLSTFKFDFVLIPEI